MNLIDKKLKESPYSLERDIITHMNKAEILYLYGREKREYVIKKIKEKYNLTDSYIDEYIELIVSISKIRTLIKINRPPQKKYIWCNIL